MYYLSINIQDIQKTKNLFDHLLHALWSVFFSEGHQLLQVLTNQQNYVADFDS